MSVGSLSEQRAGFTVYMLLFSLRQQLACNPATWKFNALPPSGPQDELLRKQPRVEPHAGRVSAQKYLSDSRMGGGGLISAEEARESLPPRGNQRTFRQVEA